MATFIGSLVFDCALKTAAPAADIAIPGYERMLRRKYVLAAFITSASMVPNIKERRLPLKIRQISMIKADRKADTRRTCAAASLALLISL